MKQKIFFLLLIMCFSISIAQNKEEKSDKNSHVTNQQFKTVKTATTEDKEFLENKIINLEKKITLVWIIIAIFFIVSTITFIIFFMRARKLGKFNERLFINKGLPTDAFLKGVDENIKGNFKIAEIYLKQELFKNPEHVNAWIALAHTYQRLERLKEALNSINTAIKLESNKPRFNKMGQISMIKVKILMESGQYKEAEDILENEILILNPNYIRAKELLKVCKLKIVKLT